LILETTQEGMLVPNEDEHGRNCYYESLDLILSVFMRCTAIFFTYYIILYNFLILFNKYIYIYI